MAVNEAKLQELLGKAINDVGAGMSVQQVNYTRHPCRVAHQLRGVLEIHFKAGRFQIPID